MDPPTKAYLTQNTYSLLSQHLSDIELARLGSTAKHARSPLVKLQSTNAYWKSRVATVFPVEEEDYIPNWKEFYEAFQINKVKAVGKYLPVDMIRRWCSANPPIWDDRFSLIEGLIAGDREEDIAKLQDLFPYKPLAISLYNVVASDGGWQMLVRRIPTLLKRLSRPDYKTYILRESTRSSDPAHFFLIRDLLQYAYPAEAKKILKPRSWGATEFEYMLERVPQNLSIYLQYFDNEDILSYLSEYDAWEAVSILPEDRPAFLGRQRLFEIAIPFYPLSALRKVVNDFPRSLESEHASILRGIQNNPHFKEVQQILKEKYRSTFRSAKEEEIYHSVRILADNTP
jgi:hypothetical protein